MNLIRWNTQPGLSNFLDNIFEGDISPAFGRKWSGLPATNIMDSKDAITLEIAVPGMKKEDFKISLESNILNISSEKQEERLEEEKIYSRREYCICSFSRSFNLPKVVDSEKIAAEYNNGILKVNIPKKQEEINKINLEIQVL